MPDMLQGSPKKPGKTEAMASYKGILRDVLDARPSGTRQRLADILGKNRSFISQIASQGSLVPVPAEHLSDIFEVCHFSLEQRDHFLAAYHRAHPRRLLSLVPAPHLREVTLRLPDLGDAKKNRLLETMLTDLAKDIAVILRGE